MLFKETTTNKDLSNPDLPKPAFQKHLCKKAIMNMQQGYRRARSATYLSIGRKDGRTQLIECIARTSQPSDSYSQRTLQLFALYKNYENYDDEMM
ncbi:hypothetical protein CEXT_542121 [Caerostris extrusa]|uniref:Uncharacterized protein n=1 Tax=Caerostris extrusa TaxID=172846 RepID=A0AAV4PCU6_CAEEX|nr:hypothetical protein CEXT_542121 [Caerostris extrusa]